VGETVFGILDTVMGTEQNQQLLICASLITLYFIYVVNAKKSKPSTINLD